MKRELLARRLFAGAAWLPEVQKHDGLRLVTETLNPRTRLDYLAPLLEPELRFFLAHQAVLILREFYAVGWAHRDFHAAKLHVDRGQLVLADFEVMEPYPAGTEVSFAQSHDFTGNVLEKPWTEPAMFFDSTDSRSLASVLGVQAADVIATVEDLNLRLPAPIASDRVANEPDKESEARSILPFRESTSNDPLAFDCPPLLT